MTSLLSRTLSFAGRHWLRLLLIGGAVFFLTEKQVNFNLRLGGSGVDPVPVSVPLQPVTPDDNGGTVLNPERSVLSEAGNSLAEAGTSLLGSFGLFGSSESPLDELARIGDAEVEAFVRRFSHVAQAEQEKFGIPASIVLANGLLHARAGRHENVTAANAYFGLRCGDDHIGPTLRTDGYCLRRYENAWTAFRDHSLYLTSGRFSPLTQFGPNDYRRWAAGMEELGYNGEDDLANQLVTVIDKFQLFRFD